MIQPTTNCVYTDAWWRAMTATSLSLTEMKPQLQAIWKVTDKVTIIVEGWKKEEDEGRQGML